MKPNFALNLTDTGIALLHRTKKGWALIGETSINDPDLPATLAALRQAALDLLAEDHGEFVTKLIIPNSQILYTEIEAPGPTAALRDAQILAELSARTPYGPDEIEFDWRPLDEPGRVFVAAVARETLDEAESFAVTHDFNPIAFVARAERVFEKEVWFGQTSVAEIHLPKGDEAEQDDLPLVFLEPALPPVLPPFEPPAQRLAISPAVEPPQQEVSRLRPLNGAEDTPSAFVLPVQAEVEAPAPQAPAPERLSIPVAEEAPAAARGPALAVTAISLTPGAPADAAERPAPTAKGDVSFAPGVTAPVAAQEAGPEATGSASEDETATEAAPGLTAGRQDAPTATPVAGSSAEDAAPRPRRIREEELLNPRLDFSAWRDAPADRFGALHLPHDFGPADDPAAEATAPALSGRLADRFTPGAVAGDAAGRLEEAPFTHVVEEPGEAESFAARIQAQASHEPAAPGRRKLPSILIGDDAEEEMPQAESTLMQALLARRQAAPPAPLPEPKPVAETPVAETVAEPLAETFTETAPEVWTEPAEPAARAAETVTEPVAEPLPEAAPETIAPPSEADEPEAIAATSAPEKAAEPPVEPPLETATREDFEDLIEDVSLAPTLPPDEPAVTPPVTAPLPPAGRGRTKGEDGTGDRTPRPAALGPLPVEPPRGARRGAERRGPLARLKGMFARPPARTAKGKAGASAAPGFKAPARPEAPPLPPRFGAEPRNIGPAEATPKAAAAAPGTPAPAPAAALSPAPTASPAAPPRAEPIPAPPAFTPKPAAAAPKTVPMASLAEAARSLEHPARRSAAPGKSPTAPPSRKLSQPIIRPAPRSRQRYQGLVIGIAFVLILAMAVAFANYLLNRDSAPPPAVLSQQTGVDSEMLADLQEGDGLAVPVGGEVSAADDAAEPDGAELAPQGGTDGTAPAAQTGVAETGAGGEIALSDPEPQPPAADQVTLPALTGQAEAVPDTPPPPPFGTVYDLDAEGRIIPQPGGIFSPEGFMLHAGKPPVVPPARPSRAAPETAAPASVTEGAAAAAASVAGASAGTASPGGAASSGSLLPEDSAAASGPIIEGLTTAPANPELAGKRPRARPEGLAPAAAPATAPASADPSTTRDGAAVQPPPARPASLIPEGAATASLLATDVAATEAPETAAIPAADAAIPTLAAASLRPRARPDHVTRAPAAPEAAAAAEADNPARIAISPRPAQRPKDFSRAVEAAVAAAMRTPDPAPVATASSTSKAAPQIRPEEQQEIDEPEVASAPAPKVPTKANVAKQATVKKAISLSRINLIGVYGSPSNRYALVRMTNGKYQRVKVGDRLDGGRVHSITQSELRYQKGNKLYALAMP